MVAGTAQESPKRFRTLAKILYHLRSSYTIRTFVWLLFLYVTCSHHLNPRFWSGGFLLNDSTEPSIYKLSSRAPRFFLPGHGRIFLLIVRIWTVYTASILLASSRILIAAFRSLSISFPHVQRYTLSDNPSSFFIFPHLLHFLLEGKKRSIFTNFFPFQASL